MSKPNAVPPKKLKYTELKDGGGVQLEILFDNPKKPGMSGKIRLVVAPWNADGAA